MSGNARLRNRLVDSPEALVAVKGAAPGWSP